jgi:hypothetical protein
MLVKIKDDGGKQSSLDIIFEPLVLWYFVFIAGVAHFKPDWAIVTPVWTKRVSHSCF